MDKIIITNADQIDIDWTKEPVFQFVDEVDALQTLQVLGQELQAAREQVRHTMRYMAAAVIAARHNLETKPQAIISHSGLARQTVYDILGEQH